MDNQKLLTISIPTWNRVSLLEELLNQLIFQITTFKLTNEVEVLVSNNFSADNTEILVLNYCQTYPFLKYSKNETNLGAKTNVIKSLYLAEAKFVLLLGDDDRIRHDCLPEIISFLKFNPTSSIIIDESKSKNKILTSTSISLDVLLANYFWYMGNAGLFISSTKHLKYNIDNYDFDFFNECWPQTQLMILGNLIDHGEIYIKNFNIPIASKHDEVMIYTSFYLWRTCILELFNTAYDLQRIIPYSTYSSCLVGFKSTIKQVFFNILQCGIFVDLSEERTRTRIHIQQHFNIFSLHEKKYLFLIILIFSIPTIISKPLSNIFIYFLKGNDGLKKKNTFVKSELKKRSLIINNSLTIRKLEFEK